VQETENKVINKKAEKAKEKVLQFPPYKGKSIT